MPVVIAEKLDPAYPGIDSLHPPESRSDRSATRGDFRRRFGPPVYGLLRKGKCGVEAVPLAASHRARTRQSRRSGRGAGDPEGARRRAWLFAPANDPAGSRYHLSARGQAAHQPRPAEANFRAPSLPGTSRGINFQRVRSPLESSRELQGQAIVRSGSFASDSTRDRHAGSSKLSQRESAWKSLRDFSLRKISWRSGLFRSRRQDVEGVGRLVERVLLGLPLHGGGETTRQVDKSETTHFRHPHPGRNSAPFRLPQGGRRSAVALGIFLSPHQTSLLHF